MDGWMDELTNEQSTTHTHSLDILGGSNIIFLEFSVSNVYVCDACTHIHNLPPMLSSGKPRLQTTHHSLQMIAEPYPAISILNLAHVVARCYCHFGFFLPLPRKWPDERIHTKPGKMDCFLIRYWVRGRYAQGYRI